MKTYLIALTLLLLIAAPVAAQPPAPTCAVGETGPECAPYRPPLDITPTPVDHITPTPTPSPTPAPHTITVVITPPPAPAATPPPVILLPETGAPLLLVALATLAIVAIVAAARVLQGVWRVALLLTTGVLAVATLLITHFMR